jgi:hypothetical protein
MHVTQKSLCGNSYVTPIGVSGALRPRNGGAAALMRGGTASNC